MPPIARITAYFESLTPASVARIAEYYTADAYFKDPFNEVRGTAAIARIFAHMFEQVQAPRFEVRDTIGAEDQVFLTWDFHFSARRLGGAQTIHGASHLRLAPDGRIRYHRDYWDAAEELYAKLPVLGGLMRWLQRRAAG